MNAETLYRIARLAAQDLAGVPGAYISLGCNVPLDVLRELAQRLDARTERTVYANPPSVIEALRGAVVAGVPIEAQGSDEVRPGDATDRAFRAGAYEYVDLSAEAGR